MIRYTVRKKTIFFFLLAGALAPLQAYVGPGAGFAFAGSFFFIFIAFFLAFFNFLTFPIRALIKYLKRRRTLKRAGFKRAVIVGFDGMDYDLLKRFRSQGLELPNFSAIEKEGTFAPLLSTEPPISPVAWSTFSTGVNPGKHNIFDFLTTDRATYMPKISCSEILPPRRTLRIGKRILPLSRPHIELLRKSKSFWKVAGEHGIFSSVLRVPFTFPPEKFYGNQLSGLGTPDLRGTQGSFSYYSETRQESTDIWEGMTEILEKTEPGFFRGRLRGPEHPFRKGRHFLSTPFTLKVDDSGRGAVLRVGKENVHLEPDRISRWIPVEFRAGMIRISGVVQLVLNSVTPVGLYVSPIHIDPAKPSMPVSHPKVFSVYLSRLLGPFATLGMAEDTTAVNEKVLSEDAFLQQVYRTQEEREKAFFDSLSKVRSGMVVQVFESTDRIQHMFWRYLPGAGSPAETPGGNDRIVNAIRDSYQAMDDFLGRLRPKLKKSDLLVIVSDHGFGPFNRGFHLNSWLHKEGYLVLKDGKQESGKWFADVDWSRSRAYGQGLNGIFLNLKGREKYGVVEPGEEAAALKAEICGKLKALRDPLTGSPVVRQAWPSESIYRGPYLRNAPDVVLGYEKGMRVSWESAVNTVGTELFSDNIRWWSGDHAFTRDQVPGIFFSNRPIREANPSLLDIAPTVLSAMGVRPPAFMEGRDLGVTAAGSMEKNT